MKTKITGTSFLCAIAILLMTYLSGCRCDDKIYMAVVVGANADCQSIAKMQGVDNLPAVAYVCPGDQVTVCWGGNVGANKITPVIGDVGQYGSETITVTETMTIKITPKNSCAGGKEFKVVVVTEPLTTKWDARWQGDPKKPNSNCNYVSFKVSEYFFSPNLRAVSAQAKFNPIDATESSCTYPPFMTGKNILDLSGSSVRLNKPFEVVPFSEQPKLVGDWIFVFEDPDCIRKCKPNAVLPFELVIDCPDEEQ